MVIEENETIPMGQQSYRSWKSAKGFSLLEILVGISIVILLAVILTPALRQGMKAAQKAKCINNLRTIGTAIYQFAADNNGNPPPGGESDSASDTTTYPLRNPTGWPYLYIENTYPKYPGVFICPADETPLRERHQNRYLNYTNNTEVLISYTDGAPQNKPYYRAFKMSEIGNKMIYMDGTDSVEDPTNTALLGTRGAVTNSSSTWKNISRRHGGFANALFGNGSVQRIDRDDPKLKSMIEAPTL